MTRSPSKTPLVRLSLSAAILSILIILVSCQANELTSFAWRSASGEKLPFSQLGGFPKGKEHVFIAAAPKNSYVLRQPMEVGDGYMVAVRMDIKKENLVVGFSLSADAKKFTDASKSGGEVRFAAQKGRTTFYLSYPSSKLLKTVMVNVTAAAAGEAASAGSNGTEAFAEVEAVSVLPAFRGFDRREKEGYRISDGISVERSGDASNLWVFKSPFAGDTASLSLLTLRYGARAEEDIVVNAGKKIIARCLSPRKEIRIPASVFPDASSQGAMSILVPDRVLLESAFIEASSPEAEASKGVGIQTASLVDPGIVLLQEALAPDEDFAWYRWDLLPEVIIFDFRDYGVQDDYLKRLAFFVEKKGFAGRLAKDVEIASLHGWNAHDYKTEDLARFFSTAAKTDFPLNEREIRLRDFLVDKGLLLQKGIEYGSGKGAIISISQESPGYLRHTFLTHESSHAIFFTDSKYRDFCIALWNGMPREEKWFWILYFGWMNYDTKSSYLMAAELQAYLIQQPPKKVEEYFTDTLPERLLEKHPELEEPIAEYMGEYGAEFEKKARMLDAWLRSNYGFGAGTTFFLR
ncbi:MAG: hypothetical protein CVV53_05450 [Spirochaetae bacterium HGW-Spirochaetae-9]|nr:MAG: hypothetical protein CVV53_05450 [Spirochaetae bacterium HGW-Spirochaetae-9]